MSMCASSALPNILTVLSMNIHERAKHEFETESEIETNY